MAKKINFNEINKNKTQNNSLADALKINNENNIEHSVKPQKTTFEKVPPESIQIDPKNQFNTLYPLNLDTVQILTSRMNEKGYDDSQCIHTARFNDEEETGEICIDGHHRRQAAIDAEIEKVPVYRHIFETRQEGLIYALELQLVRRNVDKNNLYKDFLKLKKLKEAYTGIVDISNDIFAESGKQAEHDAKLLGTSTRQVEKMNAIEKSDREDLKEALEKKEMSVDGAYKELKGIKTKKNTENEISESETDSSDPKGVVIGNHSDGIERPNIKPREPLQEAKHEGYLTGLAEGIKLAEKVFIFALAEISKGRTPHDVYFDERINFDAKTLKEFVLPEDDEKFIEEI